MGDIAQGGRSFRPIAPRTMPPGGGPGGERPLGGGIGGPPEDGKMKRASTACKECQKRRTRCAIPPGETDCTECTAHGRRCITDESSDKRRKTQAKRTQEELNDLQGLVHQIFSVIQIEDNNASLHHFLQAVRDGADVDEVRTVVQEILANQTPRPVEQHYNPQNQEDLNNDMDPNLMNNNMGAYFNPNTQ